MKVITSENQLVDKIVKYPGLYSVGMYFNETKLENGLWQYEYVVLPNILNRSDENILKTFRDNKILDLDKYDKSKEVNSFTYGDLNLWMDKDTRNSVRQRLIIEKDYNKDKTTLWFDNATIGVEMDTANAINILNLLELYASECFDNTAKHRINISRLSTLEEIYNYNFKDGYPTKLVF